MAQQALIPGLGFVNETVTTQALVPGAGFVNETVASAATFNAAWNIAANTMIHSGAQQA